jgi:hypothetical protein
MNIRKFYNIPLEKKREWYNTYIQKHGKEHKNKNDRIYYNQNKSLILALKKEYYKENRDKRLKYQKDYDDKHREKLRSNEYERRNPFN